jgi:hypothetical protein
MNTSVPAVPNSRGNNISTYKFFATGLIDSIV